MVQPSPTPASPPVPAETGRRSWMSGALIASVAGTALIAVLMVQNTQDVTFTFLFWSITMPLWLYTPLASVVGAVVWIGLGVLRRHRRRVGRRAARGD